MAIAFLKVIEWQDNSHDEIVHKVNLAGNVINRGSKLTVREGQAAVFCDKGRMADVFGPGMYKLDTDSLPVITKLLSWAYGFETPFKSDVYFVSTRQFTDNKWGTANPVIVRDPEFGAVRVRGYGTFSFRVSDPYVFLSQLSGSHSSFTKTDIENYILGLLVMNVSDALGESGLSVLDLSGNLIELSGAVKASVGKRFGELGLELTGFNIENLSMPAEVEKALDENARLGILRGNADVYMKIAQADAMRKAAENTGAAGSAMGAGFGFGMGMQMTQAMRDASGAPAKEKAGGNAGAVSARCQSCGAELGGKAKFCPECGAAVKRVCANCGAELDGKAKFCPECGKKI